MQQDNTHYNKSNVISVLCFAILVSSPFDDRSTESYGRLIMVEIMGALIYTDLNRGCDLFC